MGAARPYGMLNRILFALTLALGLFGCSGVHAPDVDGGGGDAAHGAPNFCSGLFAEYSADQTTLGCAPVARENFACPWSIDVSMGVYTECVNSLHAASSCSDLDARVAACR